MKRLFERLAILSLLAVPVAPTLADDGILLTVQKGPGPGVVTIAWTGGIPNFDVFRSPSPSAITDPSHLVIVLGARQVQDSAQPAPGAVLYYAVTSVGPCAPLNPAAICGSGERCYPTEDRLTSCAPPVGAGSQCAACSSDGQCSPIHACVSGFVDRCMKWCRIGFSTDCTFGSVCLPFSPALYAGNQQYGACACP